LFTDYSYRNNGLNTDFTSDTGREHITTQASDKGKFKVPSLRNVALTAPYMHDGSIQTLDQVLEHYRTGIQYSETLDPLFDRGDGVYAIEMSDVEKHKIIAFLNALTDYTFTKDPKFSDPF
jgi:cytochrome c peroxidase